MKNYDQKIWSANKECLEYLDKAEAGIEYYESLKNQMKNFHAPFTKDKVVQLTELMLLAATVREEFELNISKSREAASRMLKWIDNAS